MLDQIKTYENRPKALGLSREGNVLYFALFSSHATHSALSLRYLNETREIPMIRSEAIWHIGIEGLNEEVLYGFRLEGPYNPSKGLLFHPLDILTDPYTHYPATPQKWGEKQTSAYSYCKTLKPFDWQGINHPRLPLSDLIIYEMHVRGFSIDPSSHTQHPGTFLGLTEKIPYLKSLGINAVEFMPIFEFNETLCQNINPLTQQPLVNYWGYDPLFFFAPMKRFCSTDDPIQEFQTCVRELHKHGIEVILDVVYNHTGEGEDLNRKINFRGIDNSVYYMIDPAGKYRNFSGCGNTVNTNHPQVMQFIVDSLKFWVQEMKVDGFRFDLASIFTRDTAGKVLSNPPLLQKIKEDPAFQNTKLIAESWDAKGLYQVGTFPKLGPWSEWNDQFRNYTRRFLKGDQGVKGRFADCLCGSEFLYQGFSPFNSINFITAHDGFSLKDLVSYTKKNNLENGENNQDGNDHNDSWNCRYEGMSRDPQIIELREKQMRNFFLALFLSQGVPMLLMGDEYGHTRNGNNNPYVQDNERNWFQWNQNPSMTEFVSSLIAFRKNSPSLKHSHFLRGKEIDWHGTQPFKPDWEKEDSFVAYTLNGNPTLFIAFNASPANIEIILPSNHQWKALVQTELSWTQHHLKHPETAPLLSQKYTLPPYSALLAKASDEKL